MKCYGVTIQMKPLEQYFHTVPFVFQHVTQQHSEIFWIVDLNYFWQ